MRPVRPDYSWLPEHQHHVAFTLAHADELIYRVAQGLIDYLRPGPLELESIPDGLLCHVRVARVAPLPPSIPRLTADALTQLRAAIEHTLFAEVEHQIGRKLNTSEARRIEMPASTSSDGFSDWLRQRRRPDLPPMVDGAPLIARLRDLQPYNRRDADNHPLRVLAEHTNLAKHRTPAVAATFVAKVIPDVEAPDISISASSDQPALAGDTLATGPLRKRIPLSIWPMVSIQRPHTETWHVLIKELGYLEDWVRTTAIPILVTGTRDHSPLPPQIDVNIGYQNLKQALSAAGFTPAEKRSERKMLASIARDGMVETLALHPDAPPAAVIKTWAEAMNDDQILQRHESLARLGSPDKLRQLHTVMLNLLEEVRQHDE
ncbi:hypothetical protein Rhe02_09880 [Rhizocola hellebori]|uniref:Uncharacterized protein n=1 Tax=Rhizocola hellebori TaxID=1392758 RepID=A0A8J3VE14_9ACTN|nr:hypothetical protein [Rhizocola hellebori]GIH02921.1 hypothetical protein Rhe02_09880 [Rhizocola hellebori]